jgi:hypothetical protein
MRSGPTNNNNQAFYFQVSWGRLEMKSYEPKKQGQNKSKKEEKGGVWKQMTIKTKSKRRKSNKTLSQKVKRGGEKLDKKAIKKKEPKIKVEAHKLLAFTLLSNASSLVIHQSFKSLFMYSSHVKFGLLLPLFSLSIRLITPLGIGVSAGFRWICLNHLK